MSVRQKLEDVAMFLSVAGTVVVAAIVIKQRLFPTKPPLEGRYQQEQVEDWPSYYATGHRVGPDTARVTIVTFSDFQCPACRYFATATIPEIRGKYPDFVSVVYRHWPLEGHPLALPAARAAECAAAQGRFHEFHDAVFRKQDSLGIVSLLDLAKESGVRNVPAFESCFKQGGPLPSIERDIQAAKSAGGWGTPTVIVNGTRMAGMPTVKQLDSIVESERRKMDHRR